ncbi:hypothetical protein K438DRAFT_1781389 [Mycena galopus ATCC 62051]|nr:hypothetical protein K438DRAFT_1781389 [Mycena galopus ATCC 62051]
MAMSAIMGRSKALNVLYTISDGAALVAHKGLLVSLHLRSLLKPLLTHQKSPAGEGVSGLLFADSHVRVAENSGWDHIVDPGGKQITSFKSYNTRWPPRSASKFPNAVMEHHPHARFRLSMWHFATVLGPKLIGATANAERLRSKFCVKLGYKLFAKLEMRRKHSKANNVLKMDGGSICDLPKMPEERAHKAPHIQGQPSERDKTDIRYSTKRISPSSQVRHSRVRRASRETLRPFKALGTTCIDLFPGITVFEADYFFKESRVDTARIQSQLGGVEFVMLHQLTSSESSSRLAIPMPNRDLISKLISSARVPPNRPTSDKLDKYLISMASQDTVSSKLGLANDPNLRAAWRKDGERIAALLVSICSSESLEEAALLLEGDSAQHFLDVVQSVLDTGQVILDGSGTHLNGPADDSQAVCIVRHSPILHFRHRVEGPVSYLRGWIH